jgi:hypothetical protein
MVLIQSAHLNSRQAQNFDLARHYSPLKSRTVTLCSVHLTHQLHSSLGSSIHRALVIEFTSTLLKLAGDLKPTRNPTGVAADGFKFTSTLLKLTGDLKPTRNPTGASTGATFHPRMWPRTGLDGCRGCGCGRVFIKPAPNPSRYHP